LVSGRCCLIVHLLTNVTFYVNKINEHPIGASVLLPDYILTNTGVIALITGSHGPYNDDLCLLRCLAVHRGAFSAGKNIFCMTSGL
jgi:hypothetical protein